jgi:hypothetical protein
MLTGCATKNVHFVTLGLPPIPNVQPSPSEFKLNFVVENSTDTAISAGALKVAVEALWFTQHKDGACNKKYAVNVIHLDPNNGKFVKADEEFAKPAYLGDPCTCLVGGCNGVLWLTLKRQNDTQLPGPKSKLSIQWADSGAAAQMIVHDLSD